VRSLPVCNLPRTLRWRKRHMGMQIPFLGYHVNTIVDLLHDREGRFGERLVYRFLATGDVEGPQVAISYSALAKRARALGALLQREKLCGERVVLLYPAGLDFFSAFWGCLCGGVVAVPAYPPEGTRHGRFLERLRSVFADSGACGVLTT